MPHGTVVDMGGERRLVAVVTAAVVVCEDDEFDDGCDLRGNFACFLLWVFEVDKPDWRCLGVDCIFDEVVLFWVVGGVECIVYESEVTEWLMVGDAFVDCVCDVSL